MVQFWPFEQHSPVLNCQKLVLCHARKQWRVVAEEPPAAPELPLAIDTPSVRAELTHAGARVARK